MRFVTMRLIALMVLAALLGATAAGSLAAPRRAHLTLLRRSPVTLRGVGFPAHTRLTVRLAVPGTKSHRVTTSRTGTFTVVFTYGPASCSQWEATATRRGAAPVHLLGPKPECAPAGGYGGY